MTARNMQEVNMQKLAVFIWIVLAPTLMGSFVLLVVTIPALMARENQLLLPAALAGAVVAMPFSYLISRRLRNLFKKPE